MATAAAEPQLLTVCEAAARLNVNEQTIRRWIDTESIPYMELPGGSLGIPQSALLASLRDNYDLDHPESHGDRFMWIRWPAT